MSMFDDAARFAVEAHWGMTRKGDNSPYILHPFEVASIASTLTDDEEVLCAALLHDVIEDTPVTLEEVRERFGDRVAELVNSETEDKLEGIPPQETWRMRKEESLKYLEQSHDEGVKVLWLSDKLANMRSFARLHETRGDQLWQTFNQKDPAQHAWYYTSVANLSRDLEKSRAWREYTHLLTIVFKEGE